MAVGNSLAAQKQQKTGLTAYLTQDAVKKQINSVVGGKNGTRFISSIVSAVQTTPALQECSNSSILSAALLGEALNLSPSPQLGQYYMVPFKNKKKGTSEAQFQIGYKGLMQLAQRSGQYLDIDAIEIHEGEYLGRDKFTGKQKFEFIEDDDERETLPVIGYLACFELLNGFRKSIYWSKRKMQEHADKYSNAFSLKVAELIAQGKIPESEMWKYSSFWYKNFDEMARKTMLRQLFQKYGAPMSIDMVRAIDSDMAVINEDGMPDYVDNDQKEGEIVEEQEFKEVKQPDQATVQEEAEQTKAPKTETADHGNIEDDFFNN
ncbi:recombinase RecT [Robinsoniella sp.]|uniref:recombinase RecT n=1 Tax=Robinsoniella sp. TaxID=2496533 RepID=UPI003751FCDB